jgi:hypothetical protein
VNPITGSKALAGAIALGIFIMVAGCGGGGSSSAPTQPVSGPPPVVPPPPPPPPTVGTVEIVEAGLLLTSIGETRQLHARVIDTNGNPMTTATVTWTARTSGQTSGSHITIESSGLATAASLGVAQIVASASGIESAPLVGAVAKVADGAILITDAQIVGEPVSPAPGAAEYGESYQVTLTNVATPAVGAIVINTESKPVAGRVLSATSVGGQSQLKLAIIPFSELLPQFAFEEAIDLSKSKLVLDPRLAADYNLIRTADGYQLSLKTGVSKGRQTRSAKIGEIECDAEVDLGIELPLTVKLILDPTLDVKYGQFTGLERFVLDIKGGVDTELAFTIEPTAVEVECRLELATFTPPIGGVLSFILAVEIPVGVGVSGGYKVSLATLKAAATLKTSAEMQLGLDCPGGGDCDIVHSYGNFKYEFNPEFEITSSGTRIEPTARAFFYAGLGFAVVRLEDFELFETVLGLKVSGSFASSNTQIADPLYKSSYGIAATVDISPSDQLKEFTENLFGKLGLNPELETISLEFPIGNSPSGVVKADKPGFAAGERVNFQVTLEGTDLIPRVGAPYNVARLLLIRNDDGAGTVVARVNAAQDQKVFNIALTADRAGSAANYFVFVVTRSVPWDLFALEIGRAAANTLEIYRVTSICTPETDWTKRTGFNGAQVTVVRDRICSGSVPGRNLKACRYNGSWLPKHEGRSDLVYNTRNGYPGSYERDDFSITSDGTFELRYEYGWNQTRETVSQTITNFWEASYYARINPITRQSGGRFWRKIDSSSVSKSPNQTGTYNVTTLEAEVPFGNNPPAFGGAYSISEVDVLPVHVESRGIADASEIPAECTGDSPYTPL